MDPDVLYLAAQHDGMFVSVNAGTAWHQWGRSQGLGDKMPATNGNDFTRVLALTSDGRYIYFGATGASVYRCEIQPPAP